MLNTHTLIYHKYFQLYIYKLRLSLMGKLQYCQVQVYVYKTSPGFIAMHTVFVAIIHWLTVSGEHRLCAKQPNARTHTIFNCTRN